MYHVVFSLELGDECSRLCASRTAVSKSAGNDYLDNESHVVPVFVLKANRPYW